MIQRRGFTYWSLGAALLCMSAFMAPAFAEEAVPTSLDASELNMFIGTWSLQIEFNEREIELILDVVDLDGKVGATIDSARQPEPQAVEQITKNADGSANFTYDMPFGANSFKMNMHLIYSAGRLSGTLAEESNIFSVEIAGARHTGASFDGERPNPTDTKMRIGNGQKIRITFNDLDSGSEDYQSLLNTKDGDTFWYTRGRATKLFTDADLDFGDLIVKKENAAPNYPGVYSLWLKRDGDGWSLVFNEQPDIWGTQHRPQMDVGEIPLTTRTLDTPQDAFLIKLEEEANGGRIRIAWGDTEWTARFTTISEETD